MTKSERIAELERRVAMLEAEIAALKIPQVQPVPIWPHYPRPYWPWEHIATCSGDALAYRNHGFS